MPRNNVHSFRVVLPCMTETMYLAYSFLSRSVVKYAVLTRQHLWDWDIMISYNMS